MRCSPSVAACLIVAVLVLCGTGSAAFAQEGKKDKSSFVPIDTVTASVIASSGRHQVMTMQSGVDVPDPALRHYADLVTPRLRDAFTQVVQAYAAGLPPDSPPDADYLARKLQEATDRVLKKPGGRLLLGGIMIN